MCHPERKDEWKGSGQPAIGEQADQSNEPVHVNLTCQGNHEHCKRYWINGWGGREVCHCECHWRLN